MVCDGPAASCKEWAQHCAATSASAHWQTLRKQRKQQQLAPQPPVAAAQPAAAPLALAAASGVAWSCERVLREVQQ
eukprot:5639403-Prymnesium_polylepis.1